MILLKSLIFLISGRQIYSISTWPTKNEISPSEYTNTLKKMLFFSYFFFLKKGNVTQHWALCIHCQCSKSFFLKITIYFLAYLSAIVTTFHLSLFFFLLKLIARVTFLCLICCRIVGYFFKFILYLFSIFFLYLY